MRKPATWIRVSSCLVVLSLVACTSTTVIHSRPQGAKVYLGGEYVGVTPYTMSDTKIVGSTTSVRLEYPGYETMNTSITRNEEFDTGACIAGLFLLVPFLWIQGYKPVHSYELRPLGYGPPPGPPPGQYPQPQPQGYPQPQGQPAPYPQPQPQPAYPPPNP